MQTFVSALLPTRYLYHAIIPSQSPSKLEKFSENATSEGEDCSDDDRPTRYKLNAKNQCQYLGFIIGFWLLLFCCLTEACVILLNLHKSSISNIALVKTPVPRKPDVLRTFEREPSMIGLKTSQDVYDAWSHLDLPSGFVHLSNPEDYSLPPNTNVLPGVSNVYMISAYHQLHCLRELHIALFELRNDFDIAMSSLNPRHGDHKHPDPENFTMAENPPKMSWRHVEHCFSYLRQGVMCSGDAVLEGPDSNGKTLQGWGTVHQCRNFAGKDGLDEWARDQINHLS